MNGAVVVHNPDADHLKPFFGTATPKASRDPHFGKACLGNKELNNGLFCLEHNFPVTVSFLIPVGSVGPDFYSAAEPLQ